jgi:hypothetical protein
MTPMRVVRQLGRTLRTKKVGVLSCPLPYQCANRRVGISIQRMALPEILTDPSLAPRGGRVRARRRPRRRDAVR